MTFGRCGVWRLKNTSDINKEDVFYADLSLILVYLFISISINNNLNEYLFSVYNMHPIVRGQIWEEKDCLNNILELLFK